MLDSPHSTKVSSRGVPLPTSTRFRFDAFELDPASGELRKAGRLLKLQPQPFRVLALLIEHADQLVSREEIQRCLWQDSTFVDFEHGINFSINQIRAALGDSAAKPRYVETLPRRGYRFVGKLEQEPVPKPPEPPALEQTIPLPPSPPVRAIQGRRLSFLLHYSLFCWSWLPFNIGGTEGRRQPMSAKHWQSLK